VLIPLLWLGIGQQEPDLGELRRADWLGIAGLAMFLGSLTIVLEEGQRENWFDSDMIMQLSLVSALGFVFVTISQIRSERPVVKLRLLLNSSFRAVFGIVMLIGAGSFTMLYVVPVFLGTISGYNAQQTGAIAMWTGLATFMMMPLLMVMMQKVDIQFINGIGQPMVGLTLSQAATAGLAEADIPDGTALFSMARNLGGSLGLALTGILIDRRTAFHIDQIGQTTTANSVDAQSRIVQIAAGLLRDGADPAYATMRAMKMLGAEVQRQALVMSYIDGFWLMGIGIILAIPAVLFLQRPKPGATAMAH
jgi:DHA2 family multidrug resistance protein